MRRRSAFTALRDPAYLALAELCHALDDPVRATRHALEAYCWGWADGEPYVHRYALDRTVALLPGLGAEIPVSPPVPTPAPILPSHSRRRSRPRSSGFGATGTPECGGRASP